MCRDAEFTTIRAILGLGGGSGRGPTQTRGGFYILLFAPITEDPLHWGVAMYALDKSLMGSFQDSILALWTQRQGGRFFGV